MSNRAKTIQILKSFLDVRQNTKRSVIEKTTEPQINVTTYHQHDGEGNLLCEDVVVETRISPFERYPN